MSGGKLSVVVAFIGVIFIVIHRLLKNKRSFEFDKTNLMSLTFFFSTFFSILIFSLVYNNTNILLYFIVEIVSILSVYLFGYLVVRYNYISIQHISTLIVIIALITAYMSVANNLSFYALRRLRGFGGLNYTASNYAISAILALLLSFYNKGKTFIRYLFIFAFSILLIFTFLQGSRQALIGLILGILLIMFFNKGFYKKIRIYVLLFFIIVIGVSQIGKLFEISSLLLRFSSASLDATSSLRFTLYKNALQHGLDAIDLFFGKPTLYEVYNPDKVGIFNPHNIYLSSIRYFGILSGLFLLFSIVTIFYRSYRLLKKLYLKKVDLYDHMLFSTLVIFLCFFQSHLYTLFSGNITRVFHFYFYWGIIVAFIQLNKRNGNATFKQ